MVYAVIDTNIFVSAFITKNATASTRRVINSLFAGKIKPLYNDEIIEEYSEVFHIPNVSNISSALSYSVTLP